MQKPKQKPRGRPFPKGQIPPGAKPWQPGQSGNPAGYSRKKRITPLLLEILDSLIDKDNPTLGSNAKVVAAALIAEAAKGNVQAIREVFDRSDGKVPDKLDLGGSVGTYDLSKLSEDQLALLQDLLANAATES